MKAARWAIDTAVRTVPYGAPIIRSGYLPATRSGFRPAQAITNRLAFARLQRIAAGFGLDLIWLDCLPWDQVETAVQDPAGRERLSRWVAEPPYSDERYGPTAADVTAVLARALAVWTALHAARAAHGLTGPAAAVVEPHSPAERRSRPTDHPPPPQATAVRQLVAAPAAPPAL